MKWILKSLDSDRFKSVRYGLDGAGSRADLLSRLARLLGEAGSNRGSVDRYREALRLNPNLGPAREALCVSLIKGGRKVEAIECVDEYLGVNPSFTQGHFIKARLYEELGKIKEAIKSAVAGLKLDPSNQRARENLRRLQRRR